MKSLVYFVCALKFVHFVKCSPFRQFVHEHHAIHEVNPDSQSDAKVTLRVPGIEGKSMISGYDNRSRRHVLRHGLPGMVNTNKHNMLYHMNHGRAFLAKPNVFDRQLLRHGHPRYKKFSPTSRKMASHSGVLKLKNGYFRPRYGK